MSRPFALVAVIAALLLAPAPGLSRPGDRTPAAIAASPPAADAAVTRVAFGSCLQQNRPAPILDAINAFAPDTFVFLGDNVYGDTRDMARLAAAYRTLGETPGYRALREHARVLAVWDDHDMGENDAGREYPHKAESKRIMLDFFGEPPDSPRRAREGNYGSVTLGPPGRRVQFVLLDTRWFRDPLKEDPSAERKTYVPNDDPEATLLGGRQWSWLEETLTAPAEVRVICTSLQVFSDKHRFEKWGNFPRERARLIELLRKRAGDVLILSGDRHSGEISVDQWHDGRRGNVMVEVTASALNQTRTREGGRDEPNDYRAGPILYAPNFGTLEIDWDARLVTVSLRDEQGAPAKQVQLRMSEAK